MHLQAGVLYGYKVAGEGGWDTGHRWDPEKVLADPYAPLLKGRARWGQRDEFEGFTRVSTLLQLIMVVVICQAHSGRWELDSLAPQLQQNRYRG